MKTSHILLVIVTVIALTGMVATDVLLKRQYDKIDWRNPYQNFEQRALPPVHHLVIDAAPLAEVIVEQSDNNQALLLPSIANAYQAHQLGDTLFVSFKKNNNGPSRSPRDTDYGLSAGLVLRLPAIESMRMANGWLTLRRMTAGSLAISLTNSRLRMDQVTISGAFELTERQNSFAVLGNDNYQSLQVVVKDSSGIQLNNTQVHTFAKDVSPKAQVQLRGQALQWLK